MDEHRHGGRAPELVDVLIVHVDGLSCGVLCDDVAEIHQVVRPTPLPGAPAVVEGVVDVHGAVVPVVGLRPRLGLRGRPIRLSDHLVVVRAGERQFALRVDRAADVVAVRRDAIDPVGELMRDAPHVVGVARLPDGLCVIHDVAAFLSTEDLRALDAALDVSASPVAS